MTMICCGPDSVATVLTVAVVTPGLTPAPEVGTSMSTIFFVFSRVVGVGLSYLLLLRVSGPGSGSRMERFLSARTDDERF